MQARIVAMVAKSSDRQFYVKALDCVKVMRGECIQVEGEQCVCEMFRCLCDILCISSC